MPKQESETFIHPTAIVEEGVILGQAVKVWHFAHLRKGAQVGDHSIIGKGVFIDCGVKVGGRTKLQNNVSVYKGVIIEDGVFIGPHVCFTNDKIPRAISPDGNLKSESEWNITQSIVRCGASLGANSTIVCGVEIGQWCLVGAGSVVTNSIPPYAIAYGNPARIKGIVAPDGEVLADTYQSGVYKIKNSGDVLQIKSEWCLIL